MQVQNESPLISIIVPTYNQAEFLRVCINSVLAQSYDKWEMLIVNNYSTDHTREVINLFQDERIKSFDFKNNGVIARSRNFAIDKASGDWLAFLDSDDIWYKNKLDHSLKVALSHNAQAVCHSENWTYESGKIEKKIYGKGFEYDFNDLLYNGNKISTSAVLVKRDSVLAVEGFSENDLTVTAEDYHLWLKLSRSGVKFYFLEEVLGEYRIHPAGNSQSILRNTGAILHVVEEFLERQGNDSNFSLKARKARSLPLYGAARLLQRQGHYWNSLNMLFKSLLIYPFRFRSYALLAIDLGSLVLRKDLAPD